MIIKMKDDFRGPIGTFLKDEEYKVGESIVKRLPEKSYEVLEGDAEKKATERLAKKAAEQAAKRKAATEEMTDDVIDKIAEKVAGRVAEILAKKK